MLKHVHLSPYRNSMMSHQGGSRSDTLSLNSTMSCSSLSNQDPLSSRSSSYTSLNESTQSHLPPHHPPSPMVSFLLSSLLYLMRVCMMQSYHRICYVLQAALCVEWIDRRHFSIKYQFDSGFTVTRGHRKMR